MLLLLNFQFSCLFYFKKDFVHNIPLLFCLLPINILPSFNLSQISLGFSFNTKFFLWLLCHLSHLTYLCIVTNFFFLLNSVNLSFTYALSVQFSSYSLINNVILFDLVLKFETQTMSQFLELI